MGDALREPTFLILAALAPQPLHGYAIIGEVAALSGGRLELRPGTLYGALDRLAAEGLLEPDREEVIEGRLRRYYRLTDAGAGVLEQEAARLQRNADAARQRLARRRTFLEPGQASPAGGPSPPGACRCRRAQPGHHVERVQPLADAGVVGQQLADFIQRVLLVHAQPADGLVLGRTVRHRPGRQLRAAGHVAERVGQVLTEDPLPGLLIEVVVLPAAPEQRHLVPG